MPRSVRPRNESSVKNRARIKAFPWVVAVMAALNILIFLFGFFHPQQAIAHLADSPAALLQGEAYRLFSAMFLHVEPAHLMNNMLLLYFAGEMLEKEMGHIKTLLLCLGAGLCGNLFSDILQILRGENTYSLGASGMVFGIFGALLWIVLRYRGKWKQITLPRMAIMLFLALYTGFSSAYVDNAAHVGGLIGGFLLAVLLYRKRPKRDPGASK